jgi:hypothetical protein
MMMSKLEDAIFDTLTKLGMRLPSHHEGAKLDERIELMRLVSRHVANSALGALRPTAD